MKEIRWAPRVPLQWIKRLYASDASGLRDEKLLYEVGWGLAARAQSVIDVNRAHDHGIARCPECGSDSRLHGVMFHHGAVFRCGCGWSMAQKDYHATYRAQQLTGASISPFAHDFLRDWDRAYNDEDAQMRAIDALIHRFHWELEGKAARPCAVNYIEGKLPEVFRLICELARSGTPEWEEERRVWEKNVDIFKRTIWKEEETR